MKKVIRFFKKLNIKAQLRDLEYQMMFFEISFEDYLQDKEMLYNQLNKL